MLSDEEISQLKFKCQNCGYCCGGPEEGYIFVTDQELEQISIFMSVPLEELKKELTYEVRIIDKTYRSFREKPNHECVFLHQNRCIIYPVRPKQCKDYPFWPRILKSKTSWEKEKKFCPGIDKD